MVTFGRFSFFSCGESARASFLARIYLSPRLACNRAYKNMTKSEIQYNMIKVQTSTYKYLKMVIMILYPANTVPFTVPETFDVPILFL